MIGALFLKNLSGCVRKKANGPMSRRRDTSVGVTTLSRAEVVVAWMEAAAVEEG